MSLPSSLPRVTDAAQLPDAVAAWRAAAARAAEWVAGHLAEHPDRDPFAMRAGSLRTCLDHLQRAQPAPAAAAWLDAAHRARRDTTPDRREAAGHATRRNALAAEAVAAWNSAADTAETESLAVLHHWRDKTGTAPAPQPRRPAPSFH